jgi:hypothetical protein
MATERLSMHKTREILRQKWVLGRSHREVARSLGVSFGAVATVVSRAKAGGDRKLRRIHAAVRCGSGATPVRGTLRAGGGAREAAARLRIPARRAATSRRDAAAPSPRIPGAASGRVSVQPVLRALPELARAPAGDDAPGASRRREDVYRLRREEAGDRRWPHGRGDRRGALRRGDGRVELHLCRGGAVAALGGLPGKPRPRPGIFRRRPRSRGPGPTEVGGNDPVPLRAGDPEDVRGIFTSLRHGDPAGAPGTAARQGQGGSGRAGRRALDPGAAAQ